MTTEEFLAIWFLTLFALGLIWALTSQFYAEWLPAWRARRKAKKAMRDFDAELDAFRRVTGA